MDLSFQAFRVPGWAPSVTLFVNACGHELMEADVLCGGGSAAYELETVLVALTILGPVD